MIAYLALLALRGPATIERDNYGVPTIRAATRADAFFQAGFAVAEDRLWQIELSRRASRGRLAEVFGPTMAGSDREVRRLGYTDAEIQGQFDRLPAAIKESFARYADGINAYLASNPTLPPGYADNQFRPEPWTVLDSAAINIQLLQRFGQGGAGEVRNLALLTYLQGRPNLKDHVLDVFDDLAWQNDPLATPTLHPDDESRTPKPTIFARFTRETTAAQLAEIPKLSLLDLLPAVTLASRETSTRVAERLGTPYKWGSYAIVIGGKRSATGRPILLNGPQMGHSTPSVVHEMTFDVPGMQVSGIDVPGIPGIIVGATPSLAWGLTSGVADTDDVFWYPSLDADRYQFGTETRNLIRTTSVLKVKGKPDEVVERLSTPEGPVILSKPGKVIFVRASAYRGRELEAVTTLGHLVEARTAADLQESLRAEEPMSFNLFFATKDNHIGWRYMGAVPVRAPGIDPRLPVRATPDTVWRGLVSTDQMPHILDPRAGLIANWNNKPVSWWPNGDTPVWGQIFRNSSLLSFLQKPKLNAQDAELAAWSIARNDETWPYFRPYLRNAIPGFDGRLLDGSRGAGIYAGFLDALRNEIFLGTTGNFASPANFRLVTQPTLLLRALQRRTKVDYLGTRTAGEVVAAALKTASAAPPYRSGGIRVPDQVAVPYGNRGTYIQIVEMLANGPYGRNVASPGVAERGPHAFDQVPLARSWTYKPMPTWP